MRSIPCRLVLLTLAFLVAMVPHACSPARGEAEADVMTLTVAGVWPIMFYDETDIQIFQEKNPQFRLNFIDPLSASEYAERVAKGDDTFDLAFMSETSGNFQALIYRGKVAPLPDDALMADVLDMGWGFETRALNEQGVLCAYPITLWGGYHSVRADLIEKTGLGKTAGTINEYLDQMIRWYTEDAFADARASYSFSPFHESADIARNAFMELADSYLHACVHSQETQGEAPRFNTPVFREALKKIQILYELDFSKINGNPGSPSVYDSPFYLSVMDENETFLYDLPFFSQDETPAVHIMPVFLVMNPNSPNRDAAMAFLRLYSAQRSDEKNFELHPFVPYTGQDERIIAHEQDYRMAAMHICLDCYFFRPAIWINETNAWVLVSRYLEGRATAEEVLTELDAKIAAYLEAAH